MQQDIQHYLCKVNVTNINYISIELNSKDTEYNKKKFGIEKIKIFKI